ncbi:hypothetical protein PVAND_008605 [Polypedilum vanderplanki]|uniref:WD repeat-containing protein 47 n=1 Tax=Polypedilum vanderplanki TaxID=319348 RepID=A0A9J6CA44_POLVA|nr:hypothetical protein PVAND_008605 [Polypedilum vanderplanki]
MLLPSSYFDTHKNLTTNNSKMPFVRNNNNKRDKHMAAFNNNPPPPPIATQQALAMMMDYDLGNELILNNSNAYYKSKLVNAADRRSRHGSVSSQYQQRQLQQHQQQQQQQQQYYHHQKISKTRRSKSMDDFSTQMLFEQSCSSRVQKNTIKNSINDYYYPQHQPISVYNTRQNYNNASVRGNHQSSNSNSNIHMTKHKRHMRHSVDNLLEIDTSFYNNFHQVQSSDPNRPKFVAVTSLEDVQAVRCAEFHPNGTVYAVGSNSKTFRICEYPSLAEIRDDHQTYQASVLFKRTKHHKGSIYCMAWSPQGDLIATGSNDKTVKLMRYNDDQKQLEGREIELTMHDGTVRDLCFLEDSSNKSSLLISGGAGDCKIYITDCATSTPYQALSGHGSHILSLYNWGGAMFVSGSQDKTVRFWDLRTRGCVNVVTPATNPNSRQGSPVAAICVDPSGRLMVSGHEDSSCVLYDIRGNRPIQCFKPHSSDIRSIRFSPSAYYLLTGSYDNKLVLTDLQGDLTMPLPSVVVAQHTDKVISGRWHPTDFSFLSTSADKTAKLWSLPPI